MSTDPKISVRRTGRDCFVVFVDRSIGTQTIETIVINTDARTLKNYRKFLCAAVTQVTRVVFRNEWLEIRDKVNP